jgi:uncharacterized membrane protein YciS (DUF1049 family)
MRIVCLLFLAVFVAAVVLFAVQNPEGVKLVFFNSELEASKAAVLGVTYVLGMLSGWSVIGLLRRSFNRLTEDRQQRGAAAGS